ncbi:MAG: hypothetical protein HQ513_14585 [Rhodospirillales bacterium]|nr:hypothetical protein [Rhodospirillales bacterium]
MTKKNGTGDYKVGYGKPPMHTRFKPGQSGNLKGPPKKPQQKTIDVAKVLDEPVRVTKGKKRLSMSAFEAGFRKLVSRAVKGKNLDAAIEFMRLCDEYGAVQQPPTPQASGGVLVVPKNWEIDEWLEMASIHGPPPWPGKRSGLVGDEAESE